MTPDESRTLCGRVYSAAVTVPDLAPWSEHLAFKHPVLDINVMLRYLGIVDPALRATVITATQQTPLNDARDATALCTVITAAVDESTRQRT